jgi:hypothetical protein
MVSTRKRLFSSVHREVTENALSVAAIVPGMVKRIPK